MMILSVATILQGSLGIKFRLCLERKIQEWKYIEKEHYTLKYSHMYAEATVIFQNQITSLLAYTHTQK